MDLAALFEPFQLGGPIVYYTSAAMGYLADNWGSFVSLLGLVATVIGLLMVFRRAAQARESADASKVAATAASTAAQETQETIASVLNIVDLERAIAILQRLKGLHRDRKWEVSLEHYQPLRVMLTNISARVAIQAPDIREAIPQIRVMEENITRAVREGNEPTGSRNFIRVLNDIQVRLEQVASSAHLA